jgi:hypothetical protein
VASSLKQQQVPVRDVVIKGEGHEAPYGKQDWWYEALHFVIRVEGGKK